MPWNHSNSGEDAENQTSQSRAEGSGDLVDKPELDAPVSEQQVKRDSRRNLFIAICLSVVVMVLSVGGSFALNYFIDPQYPLCEEGLNCVCTQ